MLLKAVNISERIRKDEEECNDNPLVISPQKSLGDFDHFRDDGAVAVDLRLGTWFLAFKVDSCSVASFELQSREFIPGEMQYVPFGERYILHPQDFVLGVTLEWMRIPTDLGGYVNGKSSWGRRGLIIATAAVVHPGFKGCLTLELTNVGKVPIELSPGLKICQLSLHEVKQKTEVKDGSYIIDRSGFIGMRKPEIGRVKPDAFSGVLSGRKQIDKR